MLRQVVATAAMLITLLAVVIVWSALKTRAERADEVQIEAGTLARTAAALLNQYFGSLDAIASTLGRDPQIESLDARASTRLLKALVAEQPLLANVTLRDARGTLVASAVEAPSLTPPASEAVTEVLRTGRASASRLVIGPITKRRTVQLAYPVRNQDALVGVLIFSIELPRFETLFAGLQLPPGSVVALSDQNDLIMARSVDGEKYIGSTLDAATRGSTTAGVDADGVERFHGSATIERGPWLLSVAIPRAEVLRRLAPLWRRNIVILAIAIMAVIGLAMWIAWHAAFTLTHLQRVAHAIASGDFSPPEQKPVHGLEMAQLQASFVVMAEKLRTARQTLEQQFAQEHKMLDAMKTLQRQVVRQERLTAVGLLVNGIAHELNNPLQAILGTVELIERMPGTPPDVVESIGFVKAQSNRANDIIRSLSRFTRHGSGKIEAVDLRDVIGEVLQLRRTELASLSIDVTVETPATRPVAGVFAELEQVVLNFVVNAQQAIELTGSKTGRICIRLLDTLRRIRLEVADDGPGVPAENESKLFQPFFTTRPVGYGTGLGLSVSYGIINGSGGVIGYARNEWGGATFFFELPPAPEAGAEPAAHDGAAVLHGRVPPDV